LSASALPLIQMFWHGRPLSRIERLSMASFVANGHAVHLHTYEAVEGIPSGVTLKDARTILPATSIFHHAKSGSIAAFADLFRYRLLYEQGGIWADTDMVCLQPLNYSTTEVFGWMDSETINNALLGLPQGHAIARWMAECCENPNRWLPYDNLKTRRRKLKRRFLLNGLGNILWGEYGPQGFTRAAQHFGIAERALPFWHFYPLHYKHWRAMFDGSLAENPQFLSNSKAIHLWNEMFRRERGFDKNAQFPPESPFERLWARYFRTDS
jgi:glycosyl transferase-like sugar-binding protein/alpha 1,4-glycosyltransferase